MPSIHLDPTKKGLVQKTGNVVSGDTREDVAVQSLGGNDETIAVEGKGMLIRVDPTGNRTGTILEAGTVDGQMIVLLNVADAAETIAFADPGVSNVGLGAAAIIARNASLWCVWDSTLGLWHTTEP